MAESKKLTHAEWEIMEAVYKAGKSPSVRQVWEKAYPNKEKAYTTVQTIMNTLEKKGLLTRKKIGLVNFYTPVYSRIKLINSEIRHITAQMFNGSVSELAHYLININDLNIEEIQKIKKIIDRKEKELKGEK